LTTEAERYLCHIFTITKLKILGRYKFQPEPGQKHIHRTIHFFSQNCAFLRITPMNNIHILEFHY
ncbi:hypothetical protein Gotur_011255, partial [Gossypium turneri]